MPVATDSCLVGDESFFTMSLATEWARFETNEKVSESVDMFLGPSSFSELLEIAGLGIRQLVPREVNVLDDILGGSDSRD